MERTCRVDRHGRLSAATRRPWKGIHEVTGDTVVFRLIGNIRIEGIEEVKTEVDESSQVVLDIGELTPVGLEGSRFLRHGRSGPKSIVPHGSRTRVRGRCSQRPLRLSPPTALSRFNTARCCIRGLRV